MSNLIEQLCARAKADKQRIVLPESLEERTITAADMALRDELAEIILIGNPDEIHALADKLGLKHIGKATIIDPATSPKTEVACTGGEGTSVLKVTIGPAGVPDSITVLTSSGFPALDQAAQAAVEGWRFRAATRNGQPVAASIQVPVTFRLQAELPSDCYLVQERLRQGG